MYKSLLHQYPIAYNFVGTYFVFGSLLLKDFVDKLAVNGTVSGAKHYFLFEVELRPAKTIKLFDLENVWL